MVRSGPLNLPTHPERCGPPHTLSKRFRPSRSTIYGVLLICVVFWGGVDRDHTHILHLRAARLVPLNLCFNVLSDSVAGVVRRVTQLSVQCGRSKDRTLSVRAEGQNNLGPVFVPLTPGLGSKPSENRPKKPGSGTGGTAQHPKLPLGA